MGVDFGSILGRAKPATITINQASTQVEGAIPGKLRIIETGQQFDEMFVTLLDMPIEKRAYYPGEPGQLNRTNDNLLCFCSNVIRKRDRSRAELQGPDVNARMPQAAKCAGCVRGDWSKWRQTKLPKDKPQCDTYFYAVFIDTEYKMPLQMWVRSTSKAPFEAGLEELRRKFMFMQAQRMNPNIFDIRFRLSTKKVINQGRLPSYVLSLSDFKAVSPEDREALGAFYLEWIGTDKPQDEEEQVQQMQQVQTQVVNAEVVTPSGSEEIIEGEIVL